ncbi:MAG: ferrous iron transport protein A [Phycisphaerales bacterium]|nr:ferrous iron transport protein A [Phycisphaerales bacterium]
MPCPPPPDSACIPLSDLAEGAEGVIAATDIDQGDAMLLSAMGLRASSPFRLSRAGEPCIVQIGGTRIGLAARLARGIHVHVS